MRYVVTYDIADNKRRKKLSDLLEGYGIRVNHSVFEIEINATKRERLIREIARKKLFDETCDSLRFYHICQNCAEKSFEVSRRADPFTPNDCELF